MKRLISLLCAWLLVSVQPGSAQMIVDYSGAGNVTVRLGSNNYTLNLNGGLVTFANNGGNGQLLVNEASTDFSSTSFGVHGTMATMTGTTNAQVLAFNSSGGDGNAQIVSTHSGSGTTVPVEFFIDSTLTAKGQTAGGWDFGSSAVNVNITGGSAGQIRALGSIASAAAANGFLAYTSNSANATVFDLLAGTPNELLSSSIGTGTIQPIAVLIGGTTAATFGVSGGGGGVAIGSPTGGVPATGQLNLQSSVFLNNTKIVDGSTGIYNAPTGGSTTISTGVGSVKMSTANNATNTAWIPLSYAGTTYFVPAWTTNAP